MSHYISLYSAQRTLLDIVCLIKFRKCVVIYSVMQRIRKALILVARYSAFHIVLYIVEWTRYN